MRYSQWREVGGPTGVYFTIVRECFISGGDLFKKSASNTYESLADSIIGNTYESLERAVEEMVKSGYSHVPYTGGETIGATPFSVVLRVANLNGHRVYTHKTEKGTVHVLIEARFMKVDDEVQTV